MSWIQTAYLIAEIIAIPLTGWLTRVLTLRWLFVAAISLFTAASIGCAFADNFATLISFRVVAGLCRRRADPGGFLRRLPVVSAAPASGRDDAGRHRRGAGADRRPRGRRLDHRDLVLALAVPDQCRARNYRGRRHAIPVAAGQGQLCRIRQSRSPLVAADGDCAGDARDRPQTGAAGWLAFAAPADAVRRQPRQRRPSS